MSRKTGKPVTKTEARRTTIFTAVLTFLTLSVVALVAWGMNRPDANASPAATAAEEHQHEETFERITVEELKPLVDAKKVVLIDVRSMEQYSASHIPGALHIPVARVEGEVPYLPKGKLVVTYCTCPAEESSGIAATILTRSGLEAKALQGGLDAWTRLGYPIASGVQ